ncbi:MAG: hypothetical protein ACTSX9_02005 [Candidatus Njordarchaeales archaeon]
MMKKTPTLLLLILALILYVLSLASPWLRILYMAEDTVISLEKIYVIKSSVSLLYIISFIIIFAIFVTAIAYVKNNPEYQILSVFLSFLAVMIFIIALFDGVLTYANAQLSTYTSPDKKIRAIIFLEIGIYFVVLATFLNSLSLALGVYSEK